MTSTEKLVPQSLQGSKRLLLLQLLFRQLGALPRASVTRKSHGSGSHA